MQVVSAARLRRESADGPLPHLRQPAVPRAGVDGGVGAAGHRRAAAALRRPGYLPPVHATPRPDPDRGTGTVGAGGRTADHGSAGGPVSYTHLVGHDPLEVDPG